MTILVTGSAGHLGEALLRMLRAEGREVRGLDLEPSSFTDQVGTIGDRRFVRGFMAGVRAVIHTATLHKSHIATHTQQDFVDTNVTGTLVLLEEAARTRVDSFIFTSTTSAFGSALSPPAGAPAAWITEQVLPVTKNIYGATKLAAKQLCALFAHREQLPVVVLRTSRFFPEADDNNEMRSAYETANLQVNELLHRRADIEDVATAHIQALKKAPEIRFGTFIVSATTPFGLGDLPELRRNAPSVVRRLFPEFEEIYASRGWKMFATIDRVYVNAAARAALGWHPRFDFRSALDALKTGADFRSALTTAVGAKGYHGEAFTQGPYPV